MALNLNPQEREELAKRVVEQLQAGIPGAVAELRGSLAEGSADAFSDIDVLWEVPDEEFARAVDSAESILASVRPLASFRIDIDYQKSDRRRILFVRFEGIPLFWRLDIDLFAASVQRDPNYDSDNYLARGEHFSRTNSALMNAIAAIKAILRGDEATAAGLVSRGFERVSLPVPEGSTDERLLKLVDDIYEADDAVALLAAEIKELYREAFS